MLYVLRRKCIAMAVFLARKVWFYLIQKQANKCTHKKGHQQRITSFKGFISQQVIRDRRLQVRCRTGRPHTSVQAESYERIVRWQKFGTVLCVPIHSTNRCVFREYILEENTKEKKEEKRIFSNTFFDNIDERSIYKITLLTTFKSVSGGDACMYGHTLDLLDFEWIRS